MIYMKKMKIIKKEKTKKKYEKYTFKFIDDFIKEKDIQGDFIINLQNSVVDNFKDKINPEEVYVMELKQKFH